MENDIDKEVAWVVENWKKIPDQFKAAWNEESNLIAGTSKNELVVVVLIDRQKPSIQASYDFDEERIGITESGKVIWGFDSGCSCPSPWHDNYSTCYTCVDTWKQFTLEKFQGFDEDVVDACISRIEEIKSVCTK